MAWQDRAKEPKRRRIGDVTIITDEVGDDMPVSKHYLTYLANMWTYFIALGKQDQGLHRANQRPRRREDRIRPST